MPNLRIKHIPPMFTNVINETFPSPLSLPNSQIRRLPQRLSYPIQIPDVPQADCAAQFTNQLEVASSLNLCSLHKSDVIQSLTPVNSPIKYFFIFIFWQSGAWTLHESDASLTTGPDSAHFTNQTFPFLLAPRPPTRQRFFQHWASALFTDQILFITKRTVPYSQIRLTASSSPIDHCPIRRSDWHRLYHQSTVALFGDQIFSSFHQRSTTALFTDQTDSFILPAFRCRTHRSVSRFYHQSTGALFTNHPDNVCTTNRPLPFSEISFHPQYNTMLLCIISEVLCTRFVELVKRDVLTRFKTRCAH